MAQTIKGMFHSAGDSLKAVELLLAQNFKQQNIIISNNKIPGHHSKSENDDISMSKFMSTGVKVIESEPEPKDAEVYSLVTVLCNGMEEATQIAFIMSKCGATEVQEGRVDGLN